MLRVLEEAAEGPEKYLGGNATRMDSVLAEGLQVAEGGEVKERGIIFSAPMVRAVLEGRKTQHRWVIAPQPTSLPEQGTGLWHHVRGAKWESGLPYLCPYGKPGDRLWVRETWAMNEPPSGAIYRATDQKQVEAIHYKRANFKWTPSIHMPRWASRLTLEITNVRVERVQQISEEDAITEGIETDGCGHFKNYSDPTDDVMWLSLIGSFAGLWDSINFKRGHGWDSNPWVWVIAFKQVKS